MDLKIETDSPPPVPQPLASLSSSQIPPFLSKTYDLVSDPRLDAVISWVPDGASFAVWDPAEFSRTVLPSHFKHSNFSSFVRQLNTYVQQIGTQLVSPKNEEAELQKLRKEKKLLMQEVVRLKEDHLMAVQQMDNLNQRMQLAEVRQKQTVSFFARLLRHPVLLGHINHKKERMEIASRVKRKLIRNQQHSHGNSGTYTEQKIVKYRIDLTDTTSPSSLEGNEAFIAEKYPGPHLDNMVDKLGGYRYGEEPHGGSDVPQNLLFLDSNEGPESPELLNFQACANIIDSEDFILSPEDITTNKPSSDALLPHTGSGSIEDSTPIAFKGKSVVNTETDAITSCYEYPTLFPSKDASQELAPAVREDELWNMNLEVGGSSAIWDDVVHYDAQGIQIGTGPCSWWDLGLKMPGEGLDLDTYIVGESSFQDNKKEAELMS